MASQKQIISKFLKGKCAITNGGYTYLPNNEACLLYCAYGTLPGCLRTGELSTLESLLTHRSEWKEVNLRGLIEDHGFYPDAFCMSYLTAFQFNTKDYEVNLQELIDHCIKSGDFDTLKNPFKNKKVWVDYFKEKETSHLLTQKEKNILHYEYESGTEFVEGRDDQKLEDFLEHGVL